MPTLTTIPLILLLIYLWRRTNGCVLCAIAFTSVFTAASALNIGSFGVSCWLFTFVCFGLGKILRGHSQWKLTNDINRPAFRCVLAFTTYAGLSGLIFPFLFAGTMIVRILNPERLAFGMPNIAQLSYLVATVLLYLLTVSTDRAELHEVLEWYIRGCVVASGIAMYQLLNAAFHVPYPKEVLYSNPSYVIFSAYRISGIWRLNGPFTEASDMAGFLVVAIALSSWSLVTERVRFGRACGLMLMITALLMTQSSTGYVALLAGSFLLAFRYFKHIFRGGSLTQGRMAIAVVLMAAVLAGALTPAVTDAAGKMIATTLLDKQTTSSYRDRTLTHTTALQTLADTSYLGAGWGSMRASGLAYVLLGNTGILGLFLFFLMIASLFLPLFRKKPRMVRFAAEGTERPIPLGAVLFALTMLLITLVVAGSEIANPVLWLFLGVATVGPGRSLPAPRRGMGIQLPLAFAGHSTVAGARSTALHHQRPEFYEEIR